MTGFSKFLKWGLFFYEAFLGIPFLGGSFILAHSWTPLLVAFVLHLIAWVIGMRTKQSVLGHAAGAITSVLGFIPIVGMILHWITSIILLVEGIVGLTKGKNN